MGTVIRPEISEHSKYYISRHRFYELKHFCLQYYEWQRDLRKLYLQVIPEKSYNEVRSTEKCDATANLAIEGMALRRNICLVETVSNKLDPVIRPYIFNSVTRGYSYERYKKERGIPFSKDIYYKAYRKFFWELSREKN